MHGSAQQPGMELNVDLTTAADAETPTEDTAQNDGVTPEMVSPESDQS